MILNTLGWLALFWWLRPWLPVPGANYYNAANQAYEQGHYEQALAYYHRVFQDPSLGGRALYNAGNAAYQEGHYQQAMQWYEKALQLLPEDEAVWHNYTLANKKLIEAKKQAGDNSQSQHDSKPDSRHHRLSSSLADRLLKRAGAEEYRLEPVLNQKSRRRRHGSFSQDIFNLPPRELMAYIKKQTQAGYPFKAGSSLKKDKPKDDVVDW